MGTMSKNRHLESTSANELHPGHPPAPALADLEQIVSQIAQQTAPREVAKRFGISVTTLYRYLKRPEAQELLDTYRAIIKQVMLERTMGGIVHGAFDVVQNAINNKEAKDLDAATRAVMNLEKVSASASGEGRKVEVTGAGGAPINLDVRALIGQIISHADNQT